MPDGQTPQKRPLALTLGLLRVILPKCSVSYLFLTHSLTKLSRYLVVTGSGLGGGKKGLKLLRMEVLSSVSWVPTPWQLFTTLVSKSHFSFWKKAKSLPSRGTLSCWYRQRSPSYLSNPGPPQIRAGTCPSSGQNNCLWLQQRQSSPTRKQRGRGLDSAWVSPSTQSRGKLKVTNRNIGKTMEKRDQFLICQIKKVQFSSQGGLQGQSMLKGAIRTENQERQEVELGNRSWSARWEG